MWSPCDHNKFCSRPQKRIIQTCCLSARTNLITRVGIIYVHVIQHYRNCEKCIIWENIRVKELAITTNHFLPTLGGISTRRLYSISRYNNSRRIFNIKDVIYVILNRTYQQINHPYGWIYPCCTHQFVINFNYCDVRRSVSTAIALKRCTLPCFSRISCLLGCFAISSKYGTTIWKMFSSSVKLNLPRTTSHLIFHIYIFYFLNTFYAITINLLRSATNLL